MNGIAFTEVLMKLCAPPLETAFKLPLVGAASISMFKGISTLLKTSKEPDTITMVILAEVSTTKPPRFEYVPVSEAKYHPF